MVDTFHSKLSGTIFAALFAKGSNTKVATDGRLVNFTRPRQLRTASPNPVRNLPNKCPPAVLRSKMIGVSPEGHEALKEERELANPEREIKRTRARKRRTRTTKRKSERFTVRFLSRKGTEDHHAPLREMSTPGWKTFLAGVKGLLATIL